MYVYLYLTGPIKTVNNKDRLAPHLRQNMERQTRSKVIAH